MQVLSRDSLRVATDSEHFRIVQGRGTERVAFSTIMDALGIEQDRQIRAKSGKRFKQTPQLATPQTVILKLPSCSNDCWPIRDVQNVLKKSDVDIGASAVLPMHFRKDDVSLQL